MRSMLVLQAGVALLITSKNEPRMGSFFLFKKCFFDDFNRCFYSITVIGHGHIARRLGHVVDLAGPSSA